MIKPDRWEDHLPAIIQSAWLTELYRQALNKNNRFTAEGRGNGIKVEGIIDIEKVTQAIHEAIQE